jgi:hypothetical protein
MKIQVLMTPGCVNGSRARELVADVARQMAPAAEVETVTVETMDDARRWSVPGSPTIRVDGLDVDPEAPAGVGVG